MKATTLLRKQHKEVKALLKKASKGNGKAENKKLAEEIVRELKLHTKIEEKYFYPAIRSLDTKKANEMVLEAGEEHHAVDLLLAEIPRLDPSDQKFRARMKVLMDMVEHHIQEEEEEMFKLAEKLGDDRLEELGEQMGAAADEMKPTVS